MQVHNIGEIWAATLLEMTRRAVDEVGDKARAYAICFQVVVDGLKLTPANPTFLQARDSMVAALADLGTTAAITSQEQAQVRRALWRAFAQFGMGTGATSVGGGFGTNTPDSQVPDDLDDPGDVS